MRKTLVGLALVVLIGACGGSGAAGTPEGTFEAMRVAALAGDWGVIYDLMSEKASGQIVQELDKMKGYPEEVRKQACESLELDVSALDSMTAREFFEHMMKKTAPPEETENMRSAKIIDTDIEGDKAVLRFEAGGEQETMQLVRVSGKWFIDDM